MDSSHVCSLCTQTELNTTSVCVHSLVSPGDNRYRQRVVRQSAHVSLLLRLVYVVSSN